MWTQLHPSDPVRRQRHQRFWSGVRTTRTCTRTVQACRVSASVLPSRKPKSNDDPVHAGSCEETAVPCGIVNRMAGLVRPLLRSVALTPAVILAGDAAPCRHLVYM